MSQIKKEDTPVIDIEACEVWTEDNSSFGDQSTQDGLDEESLPSRRPIRLVGTVSACLLLVILLVALAMTLTFALVQEGHTTPTEATSLPSHSRRQRLGANDITSSNDEEDIIRVQVLYKTERGERIAAACAQSIIENHDDTSELVMLAPRSCLKELHLEESDIERIEEDHPVEGQSAIDLSTTMSRSNLEVTPWGISMIQADSVEMGNDANETIVCIADSGIELNHPDFNPDYITGEDAVLRTGQVWKWNEDKSGHGTHVAGIIAATQNNDMGVTGAGRIRLHIVRALDDQARGYESDMRRAINSCVDAGAKIINLSLGMSSISSTTEDLLDHVVDDLGMIVIAASGNSGTTQKFYPAAHPKVISVGAVKDDGLRWVGSTKNDQVELSAPGQKVLSTTVSSSAVQTDGFAHAAKYMEGSSHEPVTGTLKDCGNGSTKCPRNRNGICLLRLESESSVVLDMMLENCAQSRAQGAIVYKGVGNSYSTWVQHTTLSAVVVQRSVGEALINSNIGKVVTIGDVDGDKVEYTYSEMTGTSMAAPHVAAATALVWSHFSTSCSNHQIRYALAHSAFNPNATEEQKCDEAYGHGVVQVQDAYDFLSTHDCSTWDVALLSKGGCTTTSVVV